MADFSLSFVISRMSVVFLHRLFFTIVGLLAFSSSLGGVTPVPIPGSIVRLNYLGMLFPSETIYFGVDGTYTPLYYSAENPAGGTTIEGGFRKSGTYRFEFDPSNPTLARLYLNSDPAITFIYQSDHSGSSSGSSGFDVIPFVGRAGIVNASNRAYIKPGKTCITGFVAEGLEKRFYLIRAIGASLRDLGVESVNQTSFSLYQNDRQIAVGSTYIEPGPLQNGFDGLFTLAGAFPIKAGVGESLTVVQLSPGLYTVVASAGTSEGDILVEVYQMGFGTCE